MYVFLANGPQVAQARREQMFVQLLEQVDPDDAKLLIEVKDRKIKGVSKKTVQQAFPTLLPNQE